MNPVTVVVLADTKADYEAFVGKEEFDPTRLLYAETVFEVDIESLVSPVEVWDIRAESLMLEQYCKDRMDKGQDFNIIRIPKDLV